MIKKLAAIILIYMFVGCNTTKVIQPSADVVEEDTTICNSKAVLLDYTANGNCGFLFQLEDGTKLLPSTMPEVDIPFIDNKIVFIGYRKYDEAKTKATSKCGAEDQVVEILCIRKYVDPNDNTPKSYEECKPVKNVFKSTWMANVVSEISPQKISEYDYSSGYLYTFEANEVQHLYDCMGNKMCDTNDAGDCKSLLSTLEKGRVIQVLRN